MTTNFQLNPQWEFVSVDVNSMKPGTFYIPYVNRDQATALIEAPPFDIPFSNMKYMKVPLTTNHSIEIWEIREHEGKKARMNVTSSLFWYIEDETNSLVLFSNLPIDGYVKFI
ncbi:MAG: hypothetical protein ACRCX7_11150 [Cetobacterium sp.]|uniref:hypothetical protein n=1 Tax=Cetobacterium sp. TaxID=2071632 RepID=UPI003F2F3783